MLILIVILLAIIAYQFIKLRAFVREVCRQWPSVDQGPQARPSGDKPGGRWPL
jgi:hypothetical protein